MAISRKGNAVNVHAPAPRPAATLRFRVAADTIAHTNDDERKMEKDDEGSGRACRVFAYRQSARRAISTAADDDTRRRGYGRVSTRNVDVRIVFYARLRRIAGGGKPDGRSRSRNASSRAYSRGNRRGIRTRVRFDFRRAFAVVFDYSG